MPNSSQCLWTSKLAKDCRKQCRRSHRKTDQKYLRAILKSGGRFERLHRGVRHQKFWLAGIFSKTLSMNPARKLVALLLTRLRLHSFNRITLTGPRDVAWKISHRSNRSGLRECAANGL